MLTKNSRGGVCKIVVGTWTLVVLVWILSTSTALAQQTQGLILGVVKDASGAIVPDARITIQNTDTNESRSTTSGPDGAYRLPDLQPGRYSITIQKEGFTTVTQTAFTLSYCQPNGGLCSSTQTPGSIAYNWIPFDRNTVVTGNPRNWYNPLTVR